jgi:hypothetical protein
MTVSYFKIEGARKSLMALTAVGACITAPDNYLNEGARRRFAEYTTGEFAAIRQTVFHKI